MHRSDRLYRLEWGDEALVHEQSEAAVSDRESLVVDTFGIRREAVAERTSG